MMHRKWVTAADIDRWAASNPAKSALPEVVRRLVHATIGRESLERVNFPGGEETHRPGYDGETKTKTGNAWVPEGVAYWELSAREDVKTKLDEDYSTRIEKRGAGDFTSVTYIAVTARNYQGGDAWAGRMKVKGEWRDVRVYDANSLEQWLEMAPGVALWLARLIGKPVDGVSDLAEYWENLQGVLKKSLPAEIPLIGRGEISARFEQWLSGAASASEVAAESPQELIDVFCAWVVSLPIERQPAVMGRTVIVGNLQSWRELALSVQPLILVAAPRLELTSELIGEAVRGGHHVLVPVAVGKAGAYRLPRINRSSLKDALLAAGLAQAEANHLAEHSGGSFSILKRRYQRASVGDAPKWAEADAAVALAPLMLIGAWNDAAPADQAAVARAAGQTYDKILETLNRWRGEADSPLRWSNGFWEFASPMDAWSFLSPKLGRKQLDDFETVAGEVLGTDNPMYELPADERWRAQIHKKVLPHSEKLRESLARTLALLGTQSGSASVADTTPLQDRVNRIVRRILPPKAPWQRWASLGYLLPTLAEAAPDVLLGIIDADLRDGASSLVHLFAEEGGDTMTGRAEHVGLLWALEIVAWSPAYLASAVLLMAALAEKDPGGRIGNRPNASLEETFCTWHPHTMASVKQRVEVLETLLKRYPGVGWKLLLALFPESHAAISMRQTPEWRFWAEDWVPANKRSNAEHWEGVRGAVNLACGVAAKSPEKWPEIIKHLANVPKEEFMRVVALIEALEPDALDPKVRFEIWESIRGLVERHRGFSAAEWALSNEALVPLEKLRDKLRPADPILTSIPIFSRKLEMSGDRKLSWDEQQKRHRELRKRTLKAVLDARGMDGVIELARKADEPRTVGMTFADAVGPEKDGEIFPAFLLCGDKVLEAVADGCAAARVREGGFGWVRKSSLTTWDASKAAIPLSYLDFSKEAWDFVGTLGDAIEAAYWERAPFYFSHGLDAGSVELAARKLLAAGRPLAVLQMLEDHVDDAGCPPAETLMELTELAVSAPKREDYKLESNVIESIIERLRKEPALDQVRLANLEWLVLPALRWNNTHQLTLHRELARNSGLFGELLVALYKPAHRDKSADIPSEGEKRLKAERAWQLLNDWKTLPGTKADGTVDRDELRDWVRRAREKAASDDRAEVCDITIGHVLAYAPFDADGSWPSSAVRDLIDETASPDLEHGWEIAIYNKRGVVWRGEGGSQERGLAQQYEGYSRACATKSPRTAAILKRIAESYLSDARREDAEAESRR